MTCSRALGALALFGALLTLAACDDPTDVGDELIDEEGVAPERVVLPLNVDTTSYKAVTGTASPTVLGVSRFLAGQQDAPAPLGDVEATGYIDFARFSAPDLIGSQAPDSVEVTVVAGYAYGDTTSAPAFALYDLTEEWEAAGAPADTSLDIAEGAPITTFSATRGDTTTVTLPQAWILEHRSALQAEDDSVFAEEFHGFQVRPAEGSGVIGFTSSATQMTARYEPETDTSAAPTAEYALAKQLTTLRTGTRPSTSDRYVVQDGTGRALSFDLSAVRDSLNGRLSEEELSADEVAVNSAQFVFDADTTFEAAPSTFVRPQIDQLDLYGDSLASDGELTGNPFPTGGQLVLDSDASRFVNSFPLVDLLQSVLLGTSGLERLQVRPAQQTVQTRLGNRRVSVPSLSSALICRDAGSDAPCRRPRLEIVYTPIQEE